MLLRRFFDFEQIGGTWNGDGLSEVLDKRLKLNDFQEVSYTSSNASWVLLRRTRRNSATENDLLKDVRHEWEAPKGKSKKKKRKREIMKVKQNLQDVMLLNHHLLRDFK